MKHLAGIVAAAFALLGSASAQPQTSYESLTKTQVEALDGYIVRECPQNDRSLRWLALEEMDYPLRGDRDVRDSGTRIFTERYEATGCGAPPRRLSIQVFQGAEAPRMLLLPPGDTAISAGVMVDLLRTHIPQLMALRHPACRTAPPGQPIFLVTNTTHVSGVPFTPDEQVWVERWDYRACGEPSSIDISFSSNGERVRMSMTLNAPATL